MLNSSIKDFDPLRTGDVVKYRRGYGDQNWRGTIRRSSKAALTVVVATNGRLPVDRFPVDRRRLTRVAS